MFGMLSSKNLLFLTFHPLANLIEGSDMHDVIRAKFAYNYFVIMF